MNQIEVEIARLYRRVREEPRSTAFVGLADALRRAGRPGDGLQVLREGFRVHPDHPAARVVLARIHLELGNRPLATDVLVEVARNDAENLAAAALLARILVDEGRLVEARPFVERLRDANHPDAKLRELAAALVQPEPPRSRSEDPFDRPAIAGRMAARGHYGRASAILTRAGAEREALSAMERALAGMGNVEGEGFLVEERRPLPGLKEAMAALLEDTRDWPPPSGPGPVRRWARRVWGGA